MIRDKILDQFVDHLWSQVDIPVRNKIWEAIGIPVQHFAVGPMFAIEMAITKESKS